jgi:hypothetical protein
MGFSKSKPSVLRSRLLVNMSGDSDSRDMECFAMYSNRSVVNNVCTEIRDIGYI